MSDDIQRIKLDDLASLHGNDCTPFTLPAPAWPKTLPAEHEAAGSDFGYADEIHGSVISVQ